MQKDSMAQSERKQTEAATNTNVVNVNLNGQKLMNWIS